MSIKVSNVTKEYGLQKALDDVSFEVQSGSVVGFLGPNGAGKSTMMKIITRFIPQTSGVVEVNGITIDDQARDIRKDIGYLPENNPLYTDLYVKEYLTFVANIYKLGKATHRRVNELIELTGIGNEQNKKIGSLSKGYRQRVGLAQALIHNPNVLILDEPTSGLDPNQIVEIRKLIKDIGSEKTVLLSTHIMQEVEAICQKIIIINRGKIVADGSTQEIMARTTVKGLSVLVEFVEEVSQEKLSNIDNISEIKMLGSNTWLLSSKNQKDIRTGIFRFAVENGLTIITMQQKGIQLEEIFQSLTNQS
ncbi:MAG: gliding motility-associated ABC transporter ATP-binding subunit GldA [Bacteroidales bacterium]|nr:MAG: gliding motility-associated ABC transporter ATP-binding subunit GldA [Bacteroidales bacterium]